MPVFKVLSGFFVEAPLVGMHLKNSDNFWKATPFLTKKSEGHIDAILGCQGLLVCDGASQLSRRNLVTLFADKNVDFVDCVARNDTQEDQT